MIFGSQYISAVRPKRNNKAYGQKDETVTS